MRELDVSALLDPDKFGKRQALRELIDAIDLAGDQDQATWLTDGVGRIAAIVPVDVGEAHERDIAEVLATPVRHFTRTDTGRLG